MKKWAEYYYADGTYAGETPPAGSKVVEFDPDKHGMPHSKKVEVDKAIPWLMGAGGGLLAHTIASSMFDDRESDKKKRSIWKKVLAALVPAGAAAAGAYGSYLLGNKMYGGTKQAQDNSAGVTTVYSGDQAERSYGGVPVGSLMGIGIGAGGAYAGKEYAKYQFGKLKDMPKEVLPDADVVGKANVEASNLADQIANKNKELSQYTREGQMAELEKWKKLRGGKNPNADLLAEADSNISRLTKEINNPSARTLADRAALEKEIADLTAKRTAAMNAPFQKAKNPARFKTFAKGTGGVVGGLAGVGLGGWSLYSLWNRLNTLSDIRAGRKEVRGE